MSVTVAVIGSTYVDLTTSSWIFLFFCFGILSFCPENVLEFFQIVAMQLFHVVFNILV